MKNIGEQRSYVELYLYIKSMEGNRMKMKQEVKTIIFSQEMANTEMEEDYANIKFDWQMDADGTGIIITGYVGHSSIINIPAIINGMKVVAIGDGAFHHNSNITIVTIPNSIKTIGNGAFTDCSALKIVNMGNSVISIGDEAFTWCSNLGSVIIPDSVISIGTWAFSECLSIAEASIGNGVKSIGNGAFSWCSNLGSVVIGNSVNSIGDWAFSECQNITRLSFKGLIPEAGFPESIFKDNLRDLYFAPNGATGTYTRDPGSHTWAKRE